MVDMLKVTSEYPISVVLIILGFLLAASLLFESYFGLKPRPEMRKWTGGIGLVLVLVGSAMLVASLIQRSSDKISVAEVWAGQWEHESRYGNGEEVKGELEFTGRQGDSLFGEFVNTSRGGNEEGVVVGKVGPADYHKVTGTWINRLGQFGQFSFEIDGKDTERFNGFYSMGQERPEKSGNYWNGDRIAVPNGDAEGLGDVTYTHYVSSACEHQGHKGINLRSEPLPDQELIIAWLYNGARLRLIDSKDEWQIVAAQVEERLALGFIIASCNSKPTIQRLVG